MAILYSVDGKAPDNAQTGDIIVTNGGSFQITGGESGNWTSEKISDATKSTYTLGNSTDTSSSSTASTSSNAASSTYNPYSEYLANLTAQKDSATSLIENNRTSALSQTQDTYKQAQSDAYAKNLQDQANLNTTMAINGQTGGLSETMSLSSNLAYRNSLDSLATEKAYTDSTINQSANESISDLNSSYLSDVQDLTTDMADYEYKVQNDSLNNYINNISAYSNDYMAEINKLLAQGVSEDDTRILALYAARNEKIAAEEAAAAAALEKEEEATAAAKALEEERAYQIQLATAKAGTSSSSSSVASTTTDEDGNIIYVPSNFAEATRGWIADYQPMFTLSQLDENIFVQNITPQVMKDYIYYYGTPLTGDNLTIYLQTIFDQGNGREGVTSLLENTGFTDSEIYNILCKYGYITFSGGR